MKSPLLLPVERGGDHDQIERNPTGSIDIDAMVDTLCHIAQSASELAKELTGNARTMAYRIKAEACSFLIIGGAASLNGVRAGGILALDLHGNPPSRLHVRCSHLTWQARMLVAEQVAGVPAVVPLGQRLGGTIFPEIIQEAGAVRPTLRMAAFKDRSRRPL